MLQPGSVPVEGFSNPTWVAVLAVGRALHLFDHGSWFGTPDLVLYPKLVALLCCFGVFALMFSIARTVSRRPVAITLAAGTATAAVPSFVIWTTSGLENGLFALVVMAIAAVLARTAVSGRLLDPRTAVAVGILAALAALTRPDGIVFLAAFPIATVLTVGPRDGQAHRDSEPDLVGGLRDSGWCLSDVAAAHLRRLSAQHRTCQGARSAEHRRSG